MLRFPKKQYLIEYYRFCSNGGIDTLIAKQLSVEARLFQLETQNTSSTVLFISGRGYYGTGTMLEKNLGKFKVEGAQHIPYALLRDAY